MTGEPFPDRFRRWYGMLPPALRWLLTVNTVLYVAWVLFGLLQLGIVRGFVYDWFALHPELPGVLFRPWQVLTYAFLHVQPGLWGFISFAFHMLWLYWLGRDYEELYGGHRLFGMYVLSALGGSLLAILVAGAIPGAQMPVATAMGAVMGVICGIAALNPDRGIGLLILGVVPMKWVAVGFLVLSVLFSFGMWSYTAVLLGGAAAGFGFARAQQAGRDLGAWAKGWFSPSGYGAYGYSPPTEKESMLARLERRLARKTPEAAPERPERRAAISSRAPEPVATAPQDEVDRILDKISEQGYDALSKEEKRVLYEASRRG